MSANDAIRRALKEFDECNRIGPDMVIGHELVEAMDALRPLVVDSPYDRIGKPCPLCGTRVSP